MNDGFFGNAFCSLFSSGDDEITDPDMALKCVHAVCKMYDSATKSKRCNVDTMPQWILDAFDALFVACRSIVYIADPIPGQYEASSEDLVNIFDGQGEDGSLLGWGDLACAIDADSVWMSLKVECINAAEFADSIAQEYQSLVSQVMAVPLEEFLRHEATKQMCQKMNEWRSKCRVGALSSLDDLLRGRCHTLASKEFTVEDGNDMLNILTATDPTGTDAKVKVAKTMISKTLRDMSESKSVQTLQHIVSRPGGKHCHFFWALAFFWREGGVDGLVTLV
jgi:hypothetical protein